MELMSLGKCLYDRTKFLSLKRNLFSLTLYVPV